MMSRYSLQVGCITLTVKYLNCRSSGLFYFRRDIPKDLWDLYKVKGERVPLLQTYNESEAINKCQALFLRYDQEFQQFRSAGDRERVATLLGSYA